MYKVGDVVDMKFITEALINQQLRKEIVDLADLWDGNESQFYGQKLQVILKKLGIDDEPDYGELE